MATSKNFWYNTDAEKNLFSLLQSQKHIIVFDTETTGLDPVNCRIIQISAIKFEIDGDDLIEQDRLDRYIRQRSQLPAEIVKLTGITDEILEQNEYEEDTFPAIHEFFGDHLVICGHNVRFDINFLRKMYARNGVTLLDLDIESADTLEMARDLHRKDEAGSHKLGDLVRYFGLDTDLSFHNAIDDVIATSRLLRTFISEYRDRQEKKKESAGRPKPKVRVVYVSPYTGFRGMQRLYVGLSNGKTVWMNQRRPYEWGEKDKGALEEVDMEDVERQVLQRTGCADKDELSRLRKA